MELLTTVLTWFSTLPSWVNVISGIIAAAAALAALTPTPKDDTFLAKMCLMLKMLKHRQHHNNSGHHD